MVLWQNKSSNEKKNRGSMELLTTPKLPFELLLLLNVVVQLRLVLRHHGRKRFVLSPEDSSSKSVAKL